MNVLPEAERRELDLKLRTVFRPATPVNSYELFSGRRAQTNKLLAAVNQNGQHAILFGERGVGKTSLANILFFLVECPGWPKFTPHINCMRKDTYSAIWSRVFLEVSESAEKLNLDLPRKIARQFRLLEEGDTNAVNMDFVKNALTAIGSLSLLVVILDEFDTITDKDVRAQIADTIKYLSDKNVPCTVIVVGVADDVNGLIEDHLSVERCLAQVRMPRMSRDELEGIVTKSLERVDMTVTEVANQEISRISKGLPHYAHLLGLHSSLCAVASGYKNVTGDFVRESLSISIENAHQSIQNAHFRATESSQSNARYRHVLLACALAETNEQGFFSPADVREPLSRILKTKAKIENFNRHLQAFCEAESGPVLTRITIRGRPQYRFVNSLMQPYAVIVGLADGLITEDDLRATKSPREQGRLF